MIGFDWGEHACAGDRRCQKSLRLWHRPTRSPAHDQTTSSVQPLRAEAQGLHESPRNARSPEHLSPQVKHRRVGRCDAHAPAGDPEGHRTGLGRPNGRRFGGEFNEERGPSSRFCSFGQARSLARRRWQTPEGLWGTTIFKKGQTWLCSAKSVVKPMVLRDSSYSIKGRKPRIAWALRTWTLSQSFRFP